MRISVKKDRKIQQNKNEKIKQEKEDPRTVKDR